MNHRVCFYFPAVTPPVSSVRMMDNEALYFHTFVEHRSASLVAQMVKNPSAMWETWVRSLGREDPLEKCREPVWGAPPVARVMRKEAWHTQRQDQASGVPLDILEHLPPKTRVCLLYCFVLSPLTLRGLSPTTISLSLIKSWLTAPVNKVPGH